ncbi:MAG: hypothetical protein ACLVJ6_08780 [Merdibacter sp.]
MGRPATALRAKEDCGLPAFRPVPALRKRILQPLRIQRFIDPAIPSGKRLLRTLQHLQ